MTRRHEELHLQTVLDFDADEQLHELMSSLMSQELSQVLPLTWQMGPRSSILRKSVFRPLMK